VWDSADVDVYPVEIAKKEKEISEVMIAYCKSSESDFE